MKDFSLYLIIVFSLIALVCTFLVWNENYEDGLIGRLALGSLAFSSAVMVALIYEQAPMSNMKPALGLFISSVALFMLRHAYRFYMWNKGKGFNWKQRVNQ